MIVVIAVAALLVIGLAVALGLGALPRLSVFRTDPVSSAGGSALPVGQFTSDDIDFVRFDVALRGYRMSQVDDTIERLRHRIAELEDAAGDGGGVPVDQMRPPSSIAVFPQIGERRDSSSTGETPLQ